jgi:signal transduction histidine kinase
VRPATVRVVVGVSALAGAALGISAVLAATLSWPGVAAVAVCVVAGEALSITLPYRGGQVVRLGQSDAVVMAGLVLLAPAEVAAGAGIGILVWHVIDRVEPIKLAFNVAHYTVTTAAAAATFRAFVGYGTDIQPGMLGPYALAAGVFMLLGTSLVGLVVSTVTDHGAVIIIRRLMPASLVTTVGGACLGLLALGLVAQHVYLLPAIGVPTLFVMAASRQQVDAQLKEERSRALVDYERALAGAGNVTDIDRALVEGIHQVVGASAAIWRDDAWVTEIPGDSGPCPVSPDHHGVVLARAAQLGPAVEAKGAAVAAGGGVVVAWGGDLTLIEGTEEWIQRLARSAAEQVERTRAHAALVQERATLQMVVGGTSDGIYVLDGKGRIMLANTAMAALVGAPEDGLLGLDARRGFGGGDWVSAGVRDVERQDRGAITVWRVAVAAISDSGVGHICVGVVHDVSSERRLARMKDDMLAVVSHELRTPLTPIRAAAQLLGSRWRRLDDTQRQQLLDQLSDRAEHLTRLVEDLLLVAQLSSADGNAPKPSMATTDVAAAVAENVAHHNHARLDHEVAYAGPPTMTAFTDVRRLRQILDNLIDNACKFSPPGSTVSVTLERAADAARVTVTDHGRGIRSEDLERIFERFERLEDPMVMQTSGAGLGLYIVRSLVHALGGELDVHSTFGVGTTMAVTLPLPAGVDEPTSQMTLSNG